MSTGPIEWTDSAIDTKERKILSDDQLGVPGLRMIGHHSTAHALSPLERHYHKGCFELTYVVQGNVSFSVDGRMYPLSGGDLFLTLPDEVHDTGSAPMSLHQIYWFQVDLTHPDGFLFMAEPAARVLRERLYQMPDRVVKMDGDQAAAMLSAVFRYFRSGTQLGKIQGAQLLGVFLLQVVEQADLTASRITPDIGRAADYILEHIYEELPMEALAQVALLSVSRFKQKFKMEVGISPRNFINFHKVEAAKGLLLEGHSVTDTAMALNFSSSNYFSNVFRRYTSFSPSQYLAYHVASCISPDDAGCHDDVHKALPGSGESAAEAGGI